MYGHLFATLSNLSIIYIKQGVVLNFHAFQNKLHSKLKLLKVLKTINIYLYK